MLSSRRIKFFAGHLVASALVAALAATVIFLVWYPWPLNVIAGGADLLLLVMSVDVIAGPLLTLVVANPTKPRTELVRDLAVITVVQLAALSYGVYVVSEARPVALAFEIDRFRVVVAADLNAAALAEAPAELRSLSWAGPRMLAAVKPVDPAKQMRSLDLGLAGLDLSMDPSNWRPYDTSQQALAWRASKPLQEVLQKYPQIAGPAQEIAARAGRPLATLRYLPLQSRRSSWVAVLAEPGVNIAGYLPVDGFL